MITMPGRRPESIERGRSARRYLADLLPVRRGTRERCCGQRGQGQLQAFNRRWTSSDHGSPPVAGVVSHRVPGVRPGAVVGNAQAVLSDSTATGVWLRRRLAKTLPNPDSDDPPKSPSRSMKPMTDSRRVDRIGACRWVTIVAVGVHRLRFSPDTFAAKALWGEHGGSPVGRASPTLPGDRHHPRSPRRWRGSDRTSDGRGRTRRQRILFASPDQNRRGRRTGEGSNTRYRGAETGHARGPSGARAVRGGDAGVVYPRAKSLRNRLQRTLGGWDFADGVAAVLGLRSRTAVGRRADVTGGFLVTRSGLSPTVGLRRWMSGAGEGGAEGIRDSATDGDLDDQQKQLSGVKITASDGHNQPDGRHFVRLKVLACSPEHSALPDSLRPGRVRQTLAAATRSGGRRDENNSGAPAGMRNFSGWGRTDPSAGSARNVAAKRRQSFQAQPDFRNAGPRQAAILEAGRRQHSGAAEAIASCQTDRGPRPGKRGGLGGHSILKGETATPVPTAKSVIRFTGQGSRLLRLRLTSNRGERWCPHLRGNLLIDHHDQAILAFGCIRVEAL